MNIIDNLKVFNFDKKFRLGADKDGGYVIGDLDGEYDCYISAGVSDEESFSRDFINKYSTDKSVNFAFDGNITNYPYNYTDKLTFIKKNIGVINNNNECNLSFLMDTYNNIFLKMDIESGEYPWLFSLSEESLRKFKQIVIEFHGINDNGWNCDLSDKIKCLEKLSNTHYIIHAHGNNWGPVLNNIPDVIELTYINKKYFDSIPEPNTHQLPDPYIDFPNKLGHVDINLNFPPFVN